MSTGPSMMLELAASHIEERRRDARAHAERIRARRHPRLRRHQSR